MKHSYFILSGLIVLSLIGVMSCDIDPKSTLTIDKAEISISADGGSDIFHITSNTNWNIVNDNNELSVSRLSGSGDADIRVSLPETWSVKESQTRLVISTDDGAVVKNVIVVQKTKFLDGAVLQIVNHGKNIVFGGEAGARDSMVIFSNVPWQLKGPDWIEAFDGSRWVKLSDSRATVTSKNDRLGTEDYVYLRTVSQNASDGNRAGTLSVTPLYDGDIKDEENVMQLGSYGVFPNRTLPMCNSIACDWKKGTKVDYFHIAAYSKEYRDDEFTDEEIKNWDWWSPKNFVTFGGMSAGEKIYVYTAGMDNSGKFYVNHSELKTPAKEGQPLAEIVNVQFDGNYLAWDVKMNNYCAAYYQNAYYDTFDDYDATVAWIMYFGGGSKGYMESGHFAYLTDYKDAEIITWGVLKGTNTLAGTLTRYATSFYKQRERNYSRFDYPTDINLNETSHQEIVSPSKFKNIANIIIK